MKLVDYDSTLSSSSEPKFSPVKESALHRSRAHSAANLMLKLNCVVSSKQSMKDVPAKKSVDASTSLDHVPLSSRTSKVKLKTPEELYVENLSLLRQIIGVEEPSASKRPKEALVVPIQVFDAEPSSKRVKVAAEPSTKEDDDVNVEPSLLKQILKRVVRKHKSHRKQTKPRKEAIAKEVETPTTKPVEVAVPAPTKSRKKVASKDVKIPANTPACRTHGQLARETAQAQATAARAKKAGKHKIGAKSDKHKGKKADLLDVESRGDESDAKNYGSSLKELGMRFLSILGLWCFNFLKNMLSRENGLDTIFGFLDCCLESSLVRWMS